jgi:hypothetical protein
MARKSLLYKIKGRGATFRLVGSKNPKEEVSSWGAGMFRGKEFRVLETIVLTRKGPIDVFKGHGAVTGLGGSYARYRIEGVAGGTGDFGEKIRGKMIFDNKCTGSFKDFNNSNALFDTIVTSKGRFETRVWKKR